MTIKAHAFMTRLSPGSTDAKLYIEVSIVGTVSADVATGVSFEVDKALTSLQIDAQIKSAVRDWTVTNWSYSYGFLDSVQLLLATV